MLPRKRGGESFAVDRKPCKAFTRRIAETRLQSRRGLSGPKTAAEAADRSREYRSVAVNGVALAQVPLRHRPPAAATPHVPTPAAAFLPSAGLHVRLWHMLLHLLVVRPGGREAAGD